MSEEDLTTEQKWDECSSVMEGMINYTLSDEGIDYELKKELALIFIKFLYPERQHTSDITPEEVDQIFENAIKGMKIKIVPKVKDD